MVTGIDQKPPSMFRGSRLTVAAVLSLLSPSDTGITQKPLLLFEEPGCAASCCSGQWGPVSGLLLPVDDPLPSPPLPVSAGGRMYVSTYIPTDLPASSRN